MTEEAINDMLENILLVRHPKSKHPSEVTPDRRKQKERGLSARKINGAFCGKGSDYWKSPLDGAERRKFLEEVSSVT